MRARSYGDRGFSLTELTLTVAVAATLGAMAVPVITDVTANIRMNEAARLVERELQDARLKAVSANQPLRLRTNCPAAGTLRIVEVLGTAADTPVGRCDPIAYRFPPPDQNMITVPNFDGPVRLLRENTVVSTVSIQFNPDGTAQSVGGAGPVPIVDSVQIAVTRGALSRTITVNSVGKIQMQ